MILEEAELIHTGRNLICGCLGQVLKWGLLGPAQGNFLGRGLEWCLMDVYTLLLKVINPHD